MICSDGELAGRRQLLTGLGIGALAAAASVARAQGGFLPHSSWRSAERRLARRLTYGITTPDTQLAIQRGFQGYLDYQLNYEAIPDTAVDDYLRIHAPTLTMTAKQLFRTASDTAPKNLVEATIYRAINSKRQLFERMVEFWSDHFNIFQEKDTCFYLKTVDDRLVIRRFGMKTFRELLNASSRSPAMMVYLDNADSRQGDPNQNYARELMELHTLGVDGGYSERDVEEVARCFTGWTYNTDDTSSTHGNFRFDPDSHDDGEKRFMNYVIPAGGGITDAQRIIGILAGLPQTANFVSRKMCRWLLRYDPPQTLVDAVATRFRATRGDVKEMIRVILTRDNLMAAPAKHKRPYHFAISAFRVTGATIENYDSLRWWNMSTMGQMPFAWEAPNGYPDTPEYWAGLILPRWNFGINLMANQIDGVTVDYSRIVGTATTVPQVLTRINATFFAGEINPAENAALSRFLLAGELNETRIREAFGLALAMPSFNHY